MADYKFGLELNSSLAEADPKVRAALKSEGFGVLTEIDVRATLKEKLGVEVSPETILGACNPRLAHMAMEAEPGVAVLLPCNVVLRETSAGKTQVLFMDPDQGLGLIDNPALKPIAREASERLHRAAGMLAGLGSRVR